MGDEQLLDCEERRRSAPGAVFLCVSILLCLIIVWRAEMVEYERGRFCG
jgi:hypothetical protein